MPILVQCNFNPLWVCVHGKLVLFFMRRCLRFWAMSPLIEINLSEWKPRRFWYLLVFLFILYRVLMLLVWNFEPVSDISISKACVVLQELGRTKFGLDDNHFHIKKKGTERYVESVNKSVDNNHSLAPTSFHPNVVCLAFYFIYRPGSTMISHWQANKQTCFCFSLSRQDEARVSKWISSLVIIADAYHWRQLRGSFAYMRTGMDA